MDFHFPQVALLVTHYNRSQSLENLLNTFHHQNCFFGEIVVSDDGSLQPHLDVLKKLQKRFDFKLITTPQNLGLGNNINKGQDAVKMPYTLYVQEDFEPDASFTAHFSDALQMMDEDAELDLVRFYAYLRYPYLKPFKNGYSQMLIKPWFANYKKIYYYSDHPHLRRSTFLEKFGRYAEGLKGDKTEYKMCVAFIKNKGKGLFYNQYKVLFKQVNSAAEPSTMSRSNWTQSRNVFVALARDLYRQVKYNFDLIF